MASLVTTARAQQHPAAARYSGTLLANLLIAGSDWLRLYCGKTFDLQEDFDEVHDGDGTTSLFVHELPIVELTSVTILEEDGTEVALDATDFRYKAGTGEIRFGPDPQGDYSCFPTGFQNVTVTMDCGYDPVPEPVQEAAIEIALALGTLGAGSKDPSLASERLGEYSYTLRQAATEDGGILSPATRSVLAMYRTYGRGT